MAESRQGRTPFYIGVLVGFATSIGAQSSLDYQQRGGFYRLDKVARSWTPKTTSGDTWPTAPVLQHLSRLTPADLGAVVRLDRDEPGRVERVAPAVLADPSASTPVEGYRFKFRLNGNATVTARVHRDDTVVRERPENREKKGRPFTVRWPSTGHPEGWYRLIVTGFFESNNQKLYKEIRFYHKETL